MKRRAPIHRQRSQSLFRSALRHETLEQRQMFAVTAELLSGGVLDINLDADRDSADVSVAGNVLTVQGSSTNTFDLSRVNSIQARGKSGVDQSILFHDSLAIAGNLTVSDLDSVRFVGGAYSVGTVAVTARESIELRSFELSANGNITLAAQQTLTTTESGLLGFLGAVSQASASIQITDSGLFGTQINVLAQITLSANANGDNSEDVNRDLARVKSTANSEIVVAGVSSIIGKANVSLQARNVQTVSANAAALTTSTNASRDAALALTNVTSNATITLGDRLTLQANGDLSVLADNILNVTTIADGSLATSSGKGGIVALSDINVNTRVSIGAAANISAANVTTKATTNSNIVTTAKSTVGGATANDASTQQDLQASDAQGSSGGLGLAAAYARLKSNQTTEVIIAGAVTIVAVGNIVLNSDASTNATTTADGSVTNNAGDSSSGVGVAIALDRSASTNRVTISGTPTVRGLNLQAAARSSTGDRHNTSAKSGVGASNVGAAGAFASNKVASTTQATLNAATVLNSSTTKLQFSVDSQPTLTANAEPAVTSDRTPKRGIGASIARNKLTNTTTAAVADTAAINGSAELLVSANTVENVTTTSTSGSEGGNSFNAGVAMAVIDSSTDAVIGSGSALTPTAPVTLQATRGGNITTTVDGTTTGQTVARGGSFALNDVDAQVNATIDRGLTTSGNVKILSSATGAVTANAKASVKGTGTTDTTSDSQTAAEQTAGGSDKQAPSADALGKVSAGAATAINLVDIKSNSNVKSNARLNFAATVNILSSNSVDSSAKADASAVGTGTTADGTTTGGTEKGRAVAVAINRATVESNAIVTPTATVTSANGVTIDANSTVADDTSRTFSAEAISGAGARKTGFAGSFALNRVDNRSFATASSATVNVGFGALVIQSTNTGSNTAKATPSIPVTGDERGAGASFALNIVNNDSRATTQAGANIGHSTFTSGTARSMINATSNQTAVTEAKGGSGAEDAESKRTLTGVFAIEAIKNTTEANDPAAVTNLLGSLDVSAALTANQSLLAEGQSTGTEKARGLVIALDMGSNQTHATLGGQVTTTGAILVSSTAGVTQTVNGKAASKGGDITPTTGGANKSVTDAKKLATDQGAENNGEDSPSLETPEGAVAFAAAVAVGLSKTSTTADVLDSAQINTLDSIAVQATAKVNSKVKSDATAVTVDAAEEETTKGTDESSTPNPNDARGRGVGVAIAVDVHKVETKSNVGNLAQIRGSSLSVTAGTPVAAKNEFSTEAISGAGGGAVGTAGSLAVDVVHNTVDARIKAASIDVDSGALRVEAINQSDSTNSSKPSSNASGSKRGRGASVSINVTRNTTHAEIEDNALVRDTTNPAQAGAGKVSVKADSTFNTSTIAQGGAGAEEEPGKAAVTFVTSLARVVNDTQARLSGSSTGRSHASGNVDVIANQQANTTTSATGDSRAAKTAVGLVFDLDFVKDTADAVFARNWDVDGSVGVSTTNLTTATGSAKASARGGESDKKKNAAGQGDISVKTSSSKNVLQKTDGNQAIDEEIPDQSTPDGPMSLAGALALNFERAEATARIEDSADIRALGTVSALSKSQANVTTKSDASAVAIPPGENNQVQNNTNTNNTNQTPVKPDPSQTGVGVAIAINAARVKTQATIGGHAHVQATALTVDSGTDISGLNDHNFSAQSISGSGVDKIGFAGSLAIQSIENDSLAAIRNGAVVSLPASANPALASVNQNLTVTSRNETSSLAKSDASVAGSPTTGIGPSIVINASQNSSAAEVTGAILDGPMRDVVVDATGDYLAQTRAETGVTSRPTLQGEGGLAISPALAVGAHRTSTVALAGDTTQSIAANITGKLQVHATHNSSTITSAESIVNASGNAAIGTPVSVNIARDDVRAAAAGTFNVGGDASVVAHSTINAIAGAQATQNGARAGSGEAKTIEDRAQSWAQGFRREPGEPREKILDHVDDRLTEVSDKLEELSEAAMETTGVAAAGAANVVLSKTAAEVIGAIQAVGNVEVIAESDRDVTSLATGLAVAPTNADSYGGAIALNIAEQSLTAHAFGNNGLTGKRITVRSGAIEGSSQTLKARALSGGGAKDSGVAGSIGLNFVDDKIESSIGKSPVENGVLTMNASAAEGISISALNNLEVQNIAGAAAIGIESDGKGGALAINVLRTNTEALTGPTTTLTSNGPVSITAQSRLNPTVGDIAGDPIALAAGGAGGGDQARAGAVAVNILNESTKAELGNGNIVQTNTLSGPRGITLPGDVSIHADSETHLNTGAGAISLGLKLGRSVGVAMNVVNRDVSASIGDGSQITAAGNVDVDASATEDYLSIAAAPGLGGSVNKPNFGGAVQVLSQIQEVTAEVGPSSHVTATGNVVVTASHVIDADAIAGSIAGSQNQSVAGSLNVVSLLDRTDASVGDSAVINTSGNKGLVVEATGQEHLLPIAVSGTGAGSAAKAGSINLIHVDEATLAHVDASAVINARNVASSGSTLPSINVHAENTLTQKNSVGVIAGAGKKGFGGSLDTVLIDKTTRAFVASGAHLEADQNISVTADSTEDILSIAASLGGAGSTTVMGALAGYDVDVTTQAILGDSPLDTLTPTVGTIAHARGSVLVHANDQNEMDFISGGAGGSGGNAAGAAATINSVHKLTEARIAELAEVDADALANLSPLLVKNGQFAISFPNQAFESDRVVPPTLGSKDVDGDQINDLTDSSIAHPRLANPSTESRRGVIVTAVNRDDVAEIVAGAGVGSGFSVGLSTPTTILNVNTQADIGDQARINRTNQSSASNAQSVLVAAGNDLSHLSLSGALAVAGAGAIAPAGNIESTKIHTTAAIGNTALVSARQDVEVRARATEDTLMITAAGSADGSFGVSGSVAVSKLDSHTHSSIGAAADVDAGGNVIVTASDSSDLDNIAGAASLGFGGGAGVSIGVNVIHKDTQAFIANDASVDAKANTAPVTVLSDIGTSGLTTTTMQGVVVQASSVESLLNIAAAGTAGTGTGAGSISVNIIDSDTTAFIGDRARINTDNIGANAIQSVHVLAGNDVKGRSISGGVAVGVGSFAGSGDIGVVRNDTTTFIGNDAQVQANNDIVVHSLEKQDIDSLSVSGGLAIGGTFAAAAAVWVLGSQFDPTYSNDASSTNALLNGEDTVNRQATDSAQSTRNSLTSSLNNYSGVTGTVTPSATPSAQIASLLRSSRQSLSSELSTSDQLNADLFEAGDAEGTTAQVRAGAVLNAGDDVSVLADSNTDLNAIGGSAAVAAGFAAGAAVTVERTQMKTAVLMAGKIDRADEVTIEAGSINRTKGRGIAGNGAIGGALGAVVTSARDSSSTTARIDGNSQQHAAVDQARSVKAAAKSITTLDVAAGQGEIAGVAAVGVTVTKAVAEGTTSASLGDFVDIGQTAGKSVGSLQINANTTTHTQAQGLAIEAGVGAAGGLNFARAESTPSISAEMGTTVTNSNLKVKVVGSVDVDAISNTSASADMLGVQLALGASLGVSRARAVVAPNVSAAVGLSTIIDAGGDITIDAVHDRTEVISLPLGGTITVERGATARAEAGGASAIAGNTAQAQAESSPDVSAKIFGNSTLTTGSLLHVLSEVNNNATTDGGALTIGLGSAGGVQSSSTIQGTSLASVGQNANVQAANVEVLSTGLDRGVAKAVAATGGIVSGNAVSSTARLLPAQRTGKFGAIEDIPNSAVDITGATIVASGNVTIKSNERVDVDSLAKGIAIGVGFTAGKSEAVTSVKPLLDTHLGGATITAGGTMLIESRIGDASNPSVQAMNIEESDALAKDERSIAFAKGSGGALIGLIGSSADTTFKPVANTDVQRSALTATNVTIQTEDDSTAAAIARNFSLGVVARGKANANLDMKDDLSTEMSGSSETSRSTVQATNNFTLRTQSDLDGDAFSNTRAIAGFPTGRATTNIQGDYDLSASIGSNVDVTAGNQVNIASEVEQAEFGSQRTTDPDDPTSVLGHPNFFGANANSDTGGLVSDAFATSTTRLGTSQTPATTVTSIGAFSKIAAPTVSMSADVQSVNLKSDASARSAGAFVDVSSQSTGEVHSFSRLNLGSDSIIDATTVNLSALDGSSSIQSEVESTTDKDGLYRNPESIGTARMDTDVTIDARDGSMIRTRNLNVLADTNVTLFGLTVKLNDTDRADPGTRISSFERDRSIHWNADLVLKGAASPTLVVEADSAGGAVVTSASGVSIQDTDGTTLGPVAAPSIVVAPIANTSPYGNVSIKVPRRGDPAVDTGVVDGNLGSVTIQRGFEEVNLINRSSKPMTVNNINVFNMSTPVVVVDAPDSAVLAFPVFQDFGDTKINIENSIKAAAAPVLTVNGVINNPVGESSLSAGSIIKTGTGKIVTNVADLRSTSGNIGSATRLPIEIVVSDGRNEDLKVNSAGSVSLDLLARQRQATGSPVAVIDVSAVNAATTNNLLLHTTLLENSLPPTLPVLRVNEIQENDITDAVSFFETTEEIINLDRGALGTGTTTAVPSTWRYASVAGSSITVALDPAQITGPQINIVGNTDVGTGNINVSTNGNIELTELAGTMRIGAITTTRGDVTLNSNNSLTVSPVDTAADVVGNVVNLNAATSIGTAAAPLDVDSGNRLNANSTGDMVLVETAGNANVGSINSSAGNVSLAVTAGSILDADDDAAADVSGNSITLAASNATIVPAATIGTSTNALEVNSSVSGTGSVRAVAQGDVNLVESAGAMTLAEARSAAGNIRIDVPDTVGTGSNLTLSAAQVIAPAGAIQLNAGDNLTSTVGTVVQGASIGLVADFGNLDPGVGSTVNLAGTFTGRPITLATAGDADNVTLNQTTFQGQTNVALGDGNDSLIMDKLAPLTTTVGGVRDTLSINLGAGSHQVTVNSSPTGNFIAPVTATRGTGTNRLTINDTIDNDVVALNASQAAITRPGTGISELLTFGSNFDQVSFNATDGNDALAVDLAGGNLGFGSGVNFSGGAGTDQFTMSGSSQADTFEVDATSANSGVIRARVGSGGFAAPINVSTVEQVGFNGQNPTLTPGDRLIVIDSVAVVPTVPSGTLTTPLPVTYTNIEQVTIGAVPVAVNDQFRVLEDAVSSFNLFANDTGLTDLPLQVTIVQPTLGTVTFSNGATPNDISDDRFVFTPRANASGQTSFQYSVVDVNGERSTATVQVTIDPVADAPTVTAQSTSGNEGQPIALNLVAQLVDTDGSETLQVNLRQVPSIVSFVDSTGRPVGVNQGGGIWDLSGVDLRDLFLVAQDDGNFSMILTATVTESGRLFATSSATFEVRVANVAPQATIMSAPTDVTKDTTVTLQMAATDPSGIDKASGFLYRINWGDGSAIQLVQGQPGVTPSANHIYTTSGIYTVTLSATDKDGAVGPTTTQVIRVDQSGIVSDPLQPGQTMLVLQGTSGDDDIRVARSGGGREERLLVYQQGILSATYPVPTSRILVNAYGGNDTITIDPNIDTNAWLIGGAGKDSLTGGSGHNVLVGGDDNDYLRSRQGRDILIGGRGADYLFSGSDEDILIAGNTAFDQNDVALFAIQREWLGQDSLATRVAHLRGVNAGGLNAGRFLIGSGANQTAFDDSAIDTLDNNRHKDWALVNTDRAVLDLFNPATFMDELDAAAQAAAPGASQVASQVEAFISGEGERESELPSAWLDVDGNGSVTALDALLIINQLNSARNEMLEGDTDDMLDVSHDRHVTALDALLLINQLNKLSSVNRKTT